MRKAEASVGGNEDSLLYNMTASLSCICAVLCVISAAGMAAHNIFILTQASALPAYEWSWEVGAGLVRVVVVMVVSPGRTIRIRRGSNTLSYYTSLLAQKQGPVEFHM